PRPARGGGRGDPAGVPAAAGRAAASRGRSARLVPRDGTRVPPVRLPRPPPAVAPPDGGAASHRRPRRHPHGARSRQIPPTARPRTPPLAGADRPPPATPRPTPRSEAMTTLDPQAPIGQLAAERPGRADVFERLGIDYCCGGRATLA